MLKVTCEVSNYDTPVKQSLKVHSHWNQSTLVELEIDGFRYTVKGMDLIQAIKNCCTSSVY